MPAYPELINRNLPAFDQNPAVAYLFHFQSDYSRRVMSQALRVITAILTDQEPQNSDFLMLNWAALRHEHSDYVRARLVERYRPTTANRMLSALRGVLKEAWQMGQMSEADYLAAVAVANLRGSGSTRGRVLSAAEVGALVAACHADDSVAGSRDLAIIGLLYTCGLRRSEIVALNVEDFEPQAGTLRVGQQTLLLQPELRYALQALIRHIQWSSGPLFVPVLKNGRISTRRMKAQSIYDLLQKRAQQARIAALSPNDFRRSYQEAQQAGQMLSLPE